MCTQTSTPAQRRPNHKLSAFILLLAVCPLGACGNRVLGWPLECTTDCGDDTGEEDNLAPTVVWTDPYGDEVNVAVNTSAFAEFSEPMDPDSLSTATFTLESYSGLIDGSVTRISTNAIFAPTVLLDFDTEYTATLTTGVTDALGLGLESDHVWRFTTERDDDLSPPMVTLTRPDDLATDVLLGATVSAAFNESMDPLTITADTFFLMEGMTEVSGEVVYDDGALTGTFSPDDDLLPATTYTATVLADVTDLAGNAMVEDYTWTFTTGEEISEWVPVQLGLLSTFVAVSGGGLTNSNSSGTTTLNGDVGLSPTATCLGDGSPCTATNPVINGTLYANDPEGVAAQAKTDLTAAYIDAMARPVGTTVEDLSGMTLPPGVYTSDSTMSMAVGSTLTLDAEGDSDAVWIFQVGSSLTVNNDAMVLLVNGARAGNVFWGVFASSTIGSDVSFQGSVLAGASNSVGTDSTVVGRLLCTTGEITLLSDTITLPAL